MLLLARPPLYSSLIVNNRSFCHASRRLWNELLRKFANLSMISLCHCHLILQQFIIIIIITTTTTFTMQHSW